MNYKELEKILEKKLNTLIIKTEKNVSKKTVQDTIPTKANDQKICWRIQRQDRNKTRTFNP